MGLLPSCRVMSAPHKTVAIVNDAEIGMGDNLYVGLYYIHLPSRIA